MLESKLGDPSVFQQQQQKKTFYSWKFLLGNDLYDNPGGLCQYGVYFLEGFHSFAVTK